MPGNGHLWGFNVSECDFPGSGKSCYEGNTHRVDAPGYPSACSLFAPMPGWQAWLAACAGAWVNASLRGSGKPGACVARCAAGRAWRRGRRSARRGGRGLRPWSCSRASAGSGLRTGSGCPYWRLARRGTRCPGPGSWSSRWRRGRWRRRGAAGRRERRLGPAGRPVPQWTRPGYLSRDPWGGTVTTTEATSAGPTGS